MRIRAEECRAEAHATLGEYTLSAEAAEAALALDPYRERLHQRLIQARLLAGDRAAAARAYRRCHELFAREHSIAGADGPPGLRDVVGTLPAGFRHTRTRVLSEHDLVVAHGRYDGIGATPIVAFDMWRVDEGKIVEHWGPHQPWEDQTVSGHTMIDGPAEIASPGSTAASRLIVASFAELIMMGGDRTQIGRFFSDDRFVQHNPHIADGVGGLGQAIQTGVWEAVVKPDPPHRSGREFVFTQGEGLLHGQPTAFYDLFRVENGKLAEHWDVVFPRPAELRHATDCSDVVPTLPGSRAPCTPDARGRHRRRNRIATCDF